jgi:hypothetical protein
MSRNGFGVGRGDDSTKPGGEVPGLKLIGYDDSSNQLYISDFVVPLAGVRTLA